MNIFKYKKASKVKGKKKQQGGPSKNNVNKEFNIVSEEKSVENPLTQVSEKFDLLQELQRQRDDNNEDEGYGLFKERIVRAWKRFRPVNIE